MSLSHVLLGLLDEPRSGYDLKKHLDQEAGIYWSATQTQVYSTAHRLERAGLVEVATVRSRRGPSRRVFARTAEGADVLRRWVEVDTGPEPSRSATLGRIANLHRVEPGTARGAVVGRLRREGEGRLDRVREETERLGPPKRLTSANRSRYLLLTLLEQRINADLAWCNEADRTLRSDPRGESTT